MSWGRRKSSLSTILGLSISSSSSSDWQKLRKPLPFSNDFDWSWISKGMWGAGLISVVFLFLVLIRRSCFSDTYGVPCFKLQSMRWATNYCKILKSLYLSRKLVKLRTNFEWLSSMLPCRGCYEEVWPRFCIPVLLLGVWQICWKVTSTGSLPPMDPL
jgi:hypothetical protein